MRPTAEQALQQYFDAVRQASVPKSIGVRIERPMRDATIGAAAGVLLLLLLIGVNAEIEVPDNAPPVIGAQAYAQLYQTEPVRKRNETSQGETWKTRPA